MSRQIQRIRRGQQIASTRPQLNDIINAINEDGAPKGSVGVNPGFRPELTLVLEIRNFNFVDPVVGPGFSTFTCVFPGEQLVPAAQTYSVELPPTLTEAARAGVDYNYTDINNRAAVSPAETQIMTPLYIIGDLLMVQWTTHEYTWRDLNVDGRQWAKVP